MENKHDDSNRGVVRNILTGKAYELLADVGSALVPPVLLPPLDLEYCHLDAAMCRLGGGDSVASYAFVRHELRPRIWVLLFCGRDDGERKSQQRGQPGEVTPMRGLVRRSGCAIAAIALAGRRLQ